jgi:hypothetical protein
MREIRVKVLHNVVIWLSSVNESVVFKKIRVERFGT